MWILVFASLSTGNFMNIAGFGLPQAHEVTRFQTLESCEEARMTFEATKPATLMGGSACLKLTVGHAT